MEMAFLLNRPETVQSGYIDQHLTTLLRRGGCPICVETAADESSYFVWFLIETYAFPEALLECQRALGFCPKHGSRFMRHPGCSDRISFVHSRIVQYALRLLRSHADSGDQRNITSLAAPAPCPACASLQAGENRMSFFLAKLLIAPSGFQDYGHPGLLCFPHLQTLSHKLPVRLLQRVLAIHENELQCAAQRLATPLSSAEKCHSREALAATIASSLRLTVGHSPGPAILPEPETTTVSGPLRDPISDLVSQMKQELGCPTCLEIARVWREWMGWLARAARKPQDIADLLPTCREHAWACVDLCEEQLGLAVVANSLHATLRQVRNAISQFATPARGKAESRLAYAWRVFRQARLQPAQARRVIGWAVDCPVCRHLAAARDRALHLLFALLEERRYQAIFEAGYGLCLKHFSRALALQPRNRTRAVLIAVELAKLASLQWELTEYARKARWDARPERPGTEGMAWRKSINRFSGHLER